MHNTRDVFVANFVGTKLAAKNGFFGKSDPFLIISRLYEDGTYVVCWRNDHITNTLNPAWPTARIPIMALCNGDIDRPLRIAIMDWDSSGTHHPMGVVDTSVRGLLSSAGSAFNVIEADKKAKSATYVNSGTLSAQGCVIESHASMADYITGGCEVSLMVAIDFTIPAAMVTQTQPTLTPCITSIIFVLLIISDIDQTINSIIHASGSPLSIIICGVGTADFSSMVALDSDGKLLRSGSQTASRDIVQFVPFREYLAKGTIALAQETLKEIPGQFLQYMQIRKIEPNPPSPPPPYEG